MRRPDRFDVAPTAGVAIIIVVMLQVGVFAQNVTESALKAAFIYNFARFTTWPDEWPASQPFVLCVAGDAVHDALERTVKDRELATHRIVVSHAALSGPNRACHVLYVSGMLTKQAGEMVAALHDAPVLTISDIEGFTQVGGMAQFFFDQGQLRFTIRLDPVKRARLQISSKLLALAVPHE